MRQRLLLDHALQREVMDVHQVQQAHTGSQGVTPQLVSIVQRDLAALRQPVLQGLPVFVLEIRDQGAHRIHPRYLTTRAKASSVCLLWELTMLLAMVPAGLSAAI